MDVRSTIPARLDSFVGREDEIEQLSDLLTSRRLLTITGPGGVGKTRLALQLASIHASSFSGGGAFIDLSIVHDWRDVLLRIAQACAIDKAERAQILTRFRSESPAQRRLLILDNAEHVLEAAADLAELLAVAPQLVLLITSRAPLGIPGEQEFPLAPLALPPPEQSGSAAQLLPAPAIRLFLLRAQQIRPGFVLSDEDAPVLAAICRRLDGLPLAIELAAARMRLLSPAQLLNRLNDRLSVLQGTGIPDRHRTLRAAIAWSYDLLSAGAQQLFRRMAVFAGGALLDGIEAVCTDADSAALLDQLEELLQHSLVHLGESADETRYMMLETINAYAVEQLIASGEQALLHRRHAHYISALVAQVAPHLNGPEQRARLQQLEAEYENIRRAVEWSLAHDGGLIAQEIGGNLWRFFWLHGHLRDGRRWLDQALIGDSDVIALPQNAAERAALLRRAAAWRSAGNLAWAQIDYPASEAAHRRGLALAEAADDPQSIANALHGIAVIRANVGDLDAAEALYHQSLAIKRRIGDTYSAALTLNNLGFVAEQRGDDPTARLYYEESAALKRRLGEQAAAAKSLSHVGEILIRLGALADARRTLAEALSLAESAGAPVFVAEIVHWIACLAAAADQAPQAAYLFGAAEALYERYGIDLHTEDYVLTVHQVRAAREQMDAAAFGAAWQRGRHLPQNEIVTLARTILVQPQSESPVPAAQQRADVIEPSNVIEPLSERELEVLILLASGLSNQALAERLFISVNTVQTHLRHIYGKLGVASRSAAISFAYRNGLINESSAS